MKLKVGDKVRIRRHLCLSETDMNVTGVVKELNWSGTRAAIGWSDNFPQDKDSQWYNTEESEAAPEIEKV